MHSQISTILTAALSLGAAVNGLPSGANKRAEAKPGCSAASFDDFQWKISNFVYNASYIFTTPAHQNSWGYVNFDLFNPAFAVDGGADPEATCSASSSRLNDFFYGDEPYTCSSNTIMRETKFDFNHASGLLRVKDSWVCEDVDPEFPTTFGANGAVKMKLDCSNTTYVNKNWTIGDIYSSTQVTCKPVNLTLKPDEITAVA